MTLVARDRQGRVIVREDISDLSMGQQVERRRYFENQGYTVGVNP